MLGLVMVHFFQPKFVDGIWLHRKFLAFLAKYFCIDSIATNRVEVLEGRVKAELCFCFDRWVDALLNERQDRVIVPEALWEPLLAELLRYSYLLAHFDFHYEKSACYPCPRQHCLEVGQAMQRFELNCLIERVEAIYTAQPLHFVEIVLAFVGLAATFEVSKDFPTLIFTVHLLDEGGHTLCHHWVRLFLFRLASSLVIHSVYFCILFVEFFIRCLVLLHRLKFFPQPFVVGLKLILVEECKSSQCAMVASR